MIYDKKSKYGFKNDNNPININTIGYKSERNKLSSNKINYNRLNSLDNRIKMYDYSVIKIEILHEVSRFIDTLNLSENLKSEIINFSEKAYFLLKNNSLFNCRSAIYVVPMSIYLICQKNFIFLNLKKLLELINYPKETLFKVIRNYLRIDTSLFRLLHSSNHRIKKISNFCFGYIIENKLKITLYQILDFFDVYFNTLKNMKDIMISAILIRFLSKKNGYNSKVNLVKLSNYFGNEKCSLGINYNKFIRGKL